MAQKTRRRWNDVDKTDIRVSELVQQFLMHQEDRNHSPKNVRLYSDLLGRFATSLPTDARLRDINAASIRVYLAGVPLSSISTWRASWPQDPS